MGESYMSKFGGVVVKNPLSTAGIVYGVYGVAKQFKHALEEKFRSFDLPEDFTKEEYEELNQFWEQINK